MPQSLKSCTHMFSVFEQYVTKEKQKLGHNFGNVCNFKCRRVQSLFCWELYCINW